MDDTWKDRGGTVGGNKIGLYTETIKHHKRRIIISPSPIPSLVAHQMTAQRRPGAPNLRIRLRNLPIGTGNHPIGYIVGGRL